MSSARPANSAAATGAVPYVVKRLSWLAASSRSRGTRLGTVASLAGIQNRLADLDEERRDEEPPQRADQRDRQEQREPADVADDHRPAAVQPVGDDARERAEQHRRREPEDEHAGDREVRRRRSRRSRAAGRSAVSASRPSQSPRLDSDSAVQSRRNASMRSTPRRSWSGITGWRGATTCSRATSSVSSAPDGTARRTAAIAAHPTAHSQAVRPDARVDHVP